MHLYIVSILDKYTISTHTSMPQIRDFLIQIIEWFQFILSFFCQLSYKSLHQGRKAIYHSGIEPIQPSSNW